MNKKSFTIIEILVILAVLGILISLAIPRIKGMQDASNIVKVKKELKTLQLAVESYFVNSKPSVYPYAVGSVYQDLLIASSPQMISSEMLDPFCNNPDIISCGFYNKRYGYSNWFGKKYYVMWSVGVQAGNGSACTIDVLTNVIYCNNALGNPCIPNSDPACPICVTNVNGYCFNMV